MPTAQGTRRPLGRPARHDSATHALHGLALEPSAAHRAAPTSSGFRRERATAEALSQGSLTRAPRDSPAGVREGDLTAGVDGSRQTWLWPHVPLDQGLLAQG